MQGKNLKLMVINICFQQNALYLQKYINHQQMNFYIYDVLCSQYSHQNVSAGIQAISYNFNYYGVTVTQLTSVVFLQ